jgi:hypothetical protein
MLGEHSIESRGPIRGGEFYSQLSDCQGAYTGLCSVAFVRQKIMTNSHVGSCEDYCLLECDATRFGELIRLHGVTF